MKTNEEAGRRSDFRFQISDCRFGRPGSRTGACQQQKVTINHLPQGLKPSVFWGLYAGLKARSSTVLDLAQVLDLSHGAAHGAGRVARCWTRGARRALYLAALTARLKPCPSTTVPTPAFLRNLLSRAFPKDIYEVLFPCGLCACGLFARQGV